MSLLNEDERSRTAETSGLLPEGSLASRLSGAHDRPDSPDGALREGVAGLARNHDDDDDEGSEYELMNDPNLNDPNLPDEDEDLGSDVEEGLLSGAVKNRGEEEENSPYPEVRAAVKNYDEEMPCNTVRAWTIGLFLVIFGASMNTLFSLRRPSISIGPLIAQIVAWPLGHGWAKYFPNVKIPLGKSTCLELNPGPFNVKEHAIIVVMASVSFSVAYATDIILAQVHFYKQDFGLIFQLVLTISTQSLGYGIAGMLRKFLVYPSSMIWPGNLVGVTLLNAMHEVNEKPDPKVIGGKMPRFRWFGLMVLCSALYYFIPGFLAKFLSVFAVATWMAPNNVMVNQLFGGHSGLSLIPITFDWSQIAGYHGSPLIPPWHAIANTLIGVIVFYCFGAAFLHFNGAWYGKYLPMSDSTTYDNTGHAYNTTRILTPQFTLNETEYEKYSPLFISTTFALSYGLSFAAISSLIVYTILHNGKRIVSQYRSSSSEKPDIHMKLMRKYKEAPTWWYMSLFVLMLGLGFFAVLAYPTNLTWWAFLLAVVISFTFALPIGIIEAITNKRIGLNVLTEFIYGYIQPGRPLALMIFKTFGYITMSQSLHFISDLKFGHYMKIPPRTMFMCQVVATTFSCFIQITVLNFALHHIEDVCEIHQANNFTCPGGRVFFAASVIWGLIGPDRMFSPGRIYSGLFVFFIMGAILPVIIYFSIKKWPKSWVRFLMAPLIFGGAGAIPPATPLNYLSWGIVGFIFQFWIKKRHFGWWSRLNFLTSSGLDLGLALATMVIFFAFTLNHIKPPNWWGNNIVTGTLDFKRTAIQEHVKPGEIFGPTEWA